MPVAVNNINAPSKQPGKECVYASFFKLEGENYAF